MTDPTQAQFVAAFQAAKAGIIEMVNSFGLPGWEEGMVDQYITDARINVLSDEVAKAVVNAAPVPTPAPPPEATS
jgi:hypothetical protein